MLKNSSSKYSYIDNSQTKQNHIEDKLFSNKLNKNNNISSENHSIYLKKNKYPLYKNIEIEINKLNKSNKNSNVNLRPGINYPDENKDYYEMGNFAQNQNKSFKNVDNLIPINLRPNEKKRNILNKLNKINNTHNFDNSINNRSNYSYYESKCIKIKKNESYKNNTQNNSNHSIRYSCDKDKKGLNQSSTNNINRSHLIYKNININNKNERIQSPSTNYENDAYFKTEKNTINTENSNSSHKNTILRNIDNNRHYNNNVIRTVIQHKPKTPNIYFTEKIQSLKNNLEKEIYNKHLFDKNANTDIKSVPSKSPDAHIVKKIFVNPRHKKKLSAQIITDIIEENENNKEESNNLNMGKIPNFRVEKKNSHNNSILDDNKNNKNAIRVSIRNKYKNHMKNLDFNYPSTSKIQEQYRRNCEIVNVNKSKENNQLKSGVKIPKEERIIRSNIKEIKHKNSNKLTEISSNDMSIKSVIYKNNNLNLNERKNIKKDNNNESKILLSDKKNIEKEKKYMKEIEDIMNDNPTESTSQINYNNYKERNHNPKKIYLNNLSKGIIWRKKEINKNINNKTYIEDKNNKDNINIINNNNNKDNYYIRNNNNNKDNNYIINNNKNYSSTNVSIESFGHNKKSKSNDISFLNITKKTYNKNINSNKNRNISILNNNQKSNVTSLVKKDKDSISNNGIINLPKKTPINTINKTFKYEAPKILSTKDILSINDLIKEKKLRHQRNLSELPKHNNILDEIMSNAEKNKEEESGNMKNKLNRKNTYDMGNKHGKKNDNDKKENNSNVPNNDSSSMIYVKKCEALSLAGQNELGKKKINQDSYIMIKNLNRVLNFNIFGVLDGHGENGHFASQFVKRFVIQSLKNHPSIQNLKDPKEIYKILLANNYEIISNIFIDADIQIQKEKFDCESSGTTLVLVIQLEEHIICANAGDSRAIAIYDENFEDNKFCNSKIFPLSYDCKPELPNEKKRIYKCGGVVEKSYYPDLDSEDESILPFRVWAKDEDYPGLAMSRSIGDTEAKKVGVIPNPQIVEYIIRYDTKYILVCSDGIWEYMKNEECMKIANEYYLKDDPIGLCQELKKESSKLWEKIGTAIDDITIVVVFY